MQLNWWRIKKTIHREEVIKVDEKELGILSIDDVFLEECEEVHLGLDDSDCLDCD